MLRVLVAEDDELIREFVVRTLATAGHRPYAVTNGEDALAKLRDSDYDVAVLDFYMPGPGVVEIAKRCGTRERRVPVIVLTACATRSASIDCASAGVDTVLTKPVTRQELLDAVGKVAAGNSHAVLIEGRSAPARGVLDESKMEELAHNDPTGLYRRQFLRTFVSNASDIIRRIERAVQEGDSAAVREMVHRLKGSAGTAGAMAIANACDALYDGIPDGRGAELKRALADVARQLNEKYDVGAQEQGSNGIE